MARSVEQVKTEESKINRLKDALGLVFEVEQEYRKAGNPDQVAALYRARVEIDKAQDYILRQLGLRG